MKFPKYGFAFLFGLALLVFTGYLLADTFLIKRVYAVVPEASDSSSTAEQTPEETERIETVTAETEGIVPAEET